MRLEGIDNKTIEVLTLSETWLDSSTSDAEIKLPGFVFLDKTALERKRDMVVLLFMSGKDWRFVYGMTLTPAARNVYGLS